MKLFEYDIKEEKKVKKHKGRIIISESTYTYEEKLGQPFISVDFEGHNEGCGFPCDTEEIANNTIEYLKERFSNYNIEIIDKRVKNETI